MIKLLIEGKKLKIWARITKRVILAFIYRTVKSHNKQTGFS